MDMVEELGVLQQLALSLWKRLKQELSVASDAKMEYESLIYWKAVIDDFLKKARSVEVPDERLKAGINKIEEFLSDSQSAIDYYKRPAREGNRTLASISDHFKHGKFADKAKDAKGKLERCLATLKTADHSLETFYQFSNNAQARSAGCQSSIAYSEEKRRVLVGIEETKKKLFRLLTGDSLMSKVIFVHGPVGVGKTSLVGAVLRDKNVREHFKYYVWVKDLRSCELARDIEGALMEADAMVWDLTKNDDQEEQMKLAQVFIRMSKDSNSRNDGSRWALVLDDASRADVFSSLERHLSETSPIVLVTTRISKLASLSEFRLASLRRQSGDASPEPSEHGYVFRSFKHAALSKADSYKLFLHRMPDQYECAKKAERYFGIILEKCGGLPLAILAMCEHLIHKQDGAHAPQFVEWTSWSGSLQFSPLSNYEEKGSIRKMMNKCMDHFDNVRNCVLYLSIFPLDCALRYSTLMRLWMAEGFPKETLRQLVDYNFFQEVERTSYGRFGTCRVNNLLHQIIISKSMNDKFAMVIAGQEEDWPYDILRLSFHSTPKSEEVDDMTVKEVISLHVSKEVNSRFMKKLLKQVKKLKVLDLQRHFTKAKISGSSIFPEEILHLERLKYLSLRDTKVRNIPNGIEDLQCLETLDLKGTNVSQLPDGISKLKRLRHLLAYRSDRPLAANTDPEHAVIAPAKIVVTDPKHGVQAPPELGLLRSLEKLCIIDLDPVKQRLFGGKNNKRRLLLKEIGKLTNLLRLGISMLRSTDVELLFSSIGQLTNLEALRLIAAPEQNIRLSDEDVRKIPQKLKRVHLTGCLQTSPNRILSHTSVVKLVLKGSRLEGDPLKHLQELRNLMHLELQQAFDGTVVRFTAPWFEELRFLGLDKIDSLQHIIVDEGALPVLETLSLARCESLEPGLPDITRPKQLKCLKHYGMSENFKKAVEGNGNVPAHIEVEGKRWKHETIVKPIERPRNGAS